MLSLAKGEWRVRIKFPVSTCTRLQSSRVVQVCLKIHLICLCTCALCFFNELSLSRNPCDFFLALAKAHGCDLVAVAAHGDAVTALALGLVHGLIGEFYEGFWILADARAGHANRYGDLAQ